MVGFVQRFFCLAGDAGSPQRSPQSLRNAYADSARSKILAAVEQDLTDAFSRIPHPVAPAREQSLAYTRLSAQDLSPSFLFLARDLLGKIGALARTCQICRQDQVELLETLQALELAHRRSEFARARAEALATARGEALMHAQAATRDAEAQQLQLSALLQTTLEHLGCAPSPTPTRPGARASLGESRAGVEGSAAGLTLAGLLDASLDPRRQAEAAAAQPQQGTTAQEDGGGGGRARSARHQALRASLEGSLASLARGLHPDGAEAPTEEEEAPALDASRSHFSGFTVHTNDLAPGAPSSRGTRAEPFSLDNGSPSPRARAPGENAPPQAEAPRSSQGWRGIASALRSSVQGGAGGHRSIDPGQGLQDTPLAPAWTPVGPAGGEGRGTHSQAAAAAQRPAPLLLPGDVPAPVGAGSLRGKATTSLVRTGASLASPGFAKAGAMRACDAPAPGPQEGAQDSHPLPLGTFLSPTLEGMARWKGARPGVNPRDHIAAVFRNTEDLDFYHPFSAGMHGEPRPSSHRQYRSVSSSNAQALPHATENAPGGREEKEARPGLQGGGVPLQGRNM